MHKGATYTAKDIKDELQFHANANKAAILQKFFKTGKGEYGEGDIFIGITVPIQRKVAKKYTHLTFDELMKLLKSPIHEHRLTALIIMCTKFRKLIKKIDKKKYFDRYIEHMKKSFINNWDLVDTSAEHIVGQYIFTYMNNIDRSSFINKCIKSNNIWINRMIIIAMFYEIKNKSANTAFEVIEKSLQNKQDLIQKACGWMLREIGKRVSKAQLISFLQKYEYAMGRTCFRYAIEHLDILEKTKILNRE